MTAPSLTDFLLARIAEDEFTASMAEGSPDAPPRGPFNPARVLAECEAKRRIVERHHSRHASPSCAECGGFTATQSEVAGIVHQGYLVAWPCPTMRLLALPYADHPDCRQEWRP